MTTLKFVLSFAIFFSVPLHAQQDNNSSANAQITPIEDLTQLVEASKEVTGRLNDIVRGRITLTKAADAEILSKQVVNIILTAYKLNISEGHKELLVGSVITAYGEYLAWLTAPYENVPYVPFYGEEIHHRVANWVANLSMNILRDAATLIHTIPGTALITEKINPNLSTRSILEDRKTSKLAVASMSAFENVVKDEVVAELDAAQKDAFFQELVNVTAQFNKMEPVQNGPANIRVVWIYRTIAILWIAGLGNAFDWMDFFSWFSVRDYWSPLFSTTVGTLGWFSMMWARKSNSGVSVYKAAKNIFEKVSKLAGTACEAKLDKSKKPKRSRSFIPNSR